MHQKQKLYKHISQYEQKKSTIFFWCRVRTNRFKTFNSQTNRPSPKNAHTPKEMTTRMKQQYCAPQSYPPRCPIGDQYDWSDKEYAPLSYELPLFRSSNPPTWADKITCSSYEIGKRTTFAQKGVPMSVETICAFDAVRGCFTNPKGKTGLKGRGVLGRFGPNQAADAIVVRVHPVSKQTQVLVVERVDGDDASCKAWPAGMVEVGLDVPATLEKELTEEAIAPGDAVKKLFTECRVGVVYRGFVDDHRNTDEAWIETTAVLFFAKDEVGSALELSIKDAHEVKGVQWQNIDEIDTMYANHFDWLKKVKEDFLPTLLNTEKKEGGPSKKRKAEGDVSNCETSTITPQDAPSP